MKIILEFQEDDDYQVHIDGAKWRSTLFEIDQKLRGMAKHDADESAERLRLLIIEIMEDNGLRF